MLRGIAVGIVGAAAVAVILAFAVHRSPDWVIGRLGGYTTAQYNMLAARLVLTEQELDQVKKKADR